MQRELLRTVSGQRRKLRFLLGLGARQVAGISNTSSPGRIAIRAFLLPAFAVRPRMPVCAYPTKGVGSLSRVRLTVIQYGSLPGRWIEFCLMAIP